MENPIPSTTGQYLVNAVRAFLPAGISPGAALQLVIIIREKDINVRELTAYFTFLDKVYGRLTPRGLASYAQRRDEQLEISTLSKGSIEVLITELISSIDKASAMIVLLLVIKYLPEFFRAIGETAKNIEEARLTHLRTEQLRGQLEKEAMEDELDEQTRQAIVELLESLYRSEARNLPSAYRFSEKYIQDIALRIDQKE
jgi:hypothetical protein